MRKHILAILLTVIVSQPSMSETLNGKVLTLLDKLDNEIANVGVCQKTKQRNIGAYRRNLRTASTIKEQYRANMQLYDEYKVYNSDSAVYFANANLKIAEMQNDLNNIAKWKSRKAFVLIGNGKMWDAKALLSDIRSQDLDIDTRIEYYEEMLHLHSHIVLYKAEVDRGHSKQLVPVYKDSIRQICPPTHPLYLWYKANRLEAGEKSDSLRKELITVTLKLPDNTRIYAMNTYIISQLFKRDGNRDEELEWLIRSSIADVRSVNREIASLEVLAKELYALGYIDPAYRYISYCHEQALVYNNRVRLFSVTKVEQNIFDRVLQDRTHQQNTLRMYFIILIVFAILLLGLVFYVIRINRRLHHSRSKLTIANEKLTEQKETLSQQNIRITDSNSQLEQLNSQLKVLNDELSQSMLQLNEANYVKEEYIGAMFYLCSTYISKMDDFRKTLNRKLRANMYADARAMTERTAELQTVIKEFYSTFDAIFLNIYPTFIDDFNALLRPEERITLKEGQLLNTELRIHALVCMGVTDTLRISHVLHCSPQTVYNNRTRTRNKALLAGKDFDDTVRKLGKQTTAMKD